MCLFLCLSNCFPSKWTLCLCMKDGSPASTCSSSPKLDWMIKRGMVGLCLKCVLVWFIFPHRLFPGFVTRLQFTFDVAWIAFVWIIFVEFDGSVIEIKHSGVHAFRCREDDRIWFGVSISACTNYRAWPFELHCPDMLHRCHTSHVVVFSCLFFCWFGSFVTSSLSIF